MKVEMPQVGQSEAIPLSIALYMDVHIRRAVTSALRLRSIDVLTAQEDGAAELDDDRLLERATELGRVLVSQDDDLLREGARRLSERKAFSGIIYSHHD
jgi:predicted nuclease of predicted toxin-antitoxin system